MTVPCRLRLTNGEGDGPPGRAEVKFYKSTMNPGETSPAPAKDSMGMDIDAGVRNRGRRK